MQSARVKPKIQGLENPQDGEVSPVSIEDCQHWFTASLCEGEQTHCPAARKQCGSRGESASYVSQDRSRGAPAARREQEE